MFSTKTHDKMHWLGRFLAGIQWRGPHRPWSRRVKRVVLTEDEPDDVSDVGDPSAGPNTLWSYSNFIFGQWDDISTIHRVPFNLQSSYESGPSPLLIPAISSTPAEILARPDVREGFFSDNFALYWTDQLNDYNRWLEPLHEEHKMTALSPKNKPPMTKQRLPSPPPFTEVQIGPKSPRMSDPIDKWLTQDDDPGKSEDGSLKGSLKKSLRRVRPGTKAADMACAMPPQLLTEVSTHQAQLLGVGRAYGRISLTVHQVESAFQLQEHLKYLLEKHTHPPGSEHFTTRLTRDTALAIANPPTDIDRNLWLYELCRLLVVKADQLIVHFFTEHPPCSAQTCPEMRASEWQYLCAVHDPPKPCCAIDYCCHTLDWAAYTLASQTNFPSRLSLGNDGTGVRQLTNIMRRVYRIFAHAWFQHPEVFTRVENSEGLYMLFKTVCDVYQLIPEENYTIPPEAEGLAAKEEEKREGKAVLREQGVDESVRNDDADAPTTISTGATTRRHKATPSFSASVAAIAEGDEEDTSPTKDKTGGRLEAISESTMKDAPLAQISKSAEKKTDQPATPHENSMGQPNPDSADLDSEKESSVRTVIKYNEGGNEHEVTSDDEGEQTTAEGVIDQKSAEEKND